MIVKVDAADIKINKTQAEEDTVFFIGNMFTIKEQMKKLFRIQYADLDYDDEERTCWFTAITEVTEDATDGIEAWLTNYGFTVEVCDFRTK